MDGVMDPYEKERVGVDRDQGEKVDGCAGLGGEGWGVGGDAEC
jgi:hypothetical protein